MLMAVRGSNEIEAWGMEAWGGANHELWFWAAFNHQSSRGMIFRGLYYAHTSSMQDWLYVNILNLESELVRAR